MAIKSIEMGKTKLIKNFRQRRMFLVLALLASCGWATAQTSYIYFDLAAGDVTINSTSYSGFIFKTEGGTTTTETVSGSHSSGNHYFVYQSQDTYQSATSSYRTTTGLVNGTMVVPSYDRVEDWADYTKNNTDVNTVIQEWRTRAAATYRVPHLHRIDVRCATNMNVDLTIQDLWSNQQTGGSTVRSGGLRVFCDNGSSIKNARVSLHYLGDNRFGNIYYLSGRGAGNQMVFDSPDAEHTGTLTVANIQENANTNYWRAVIGADDSTGNADGLVFDNGFVYVGATPQDNCTAIGGGGNDFGGVTINGGVVTAVASTTGTAIGGGIGWSSNGGNAYVRITDGEVYAYNFGISELSPNEYTSCVPVAAIGGGSSQSSSGNNDTQVVIEGGRVYAYSAAGAAIGGGSTSTLYGGKATITIGKANGDGPFIEATSVASKYKTYSAPAGVSIGGGTGGYGGANTNGGNVTLNILGGEIYAYAQEMENGQLGPREYGHIGGGKTNGAGSGGSATINVSNGVLYASTIGGGDAKTGQGGYASVTITNGSIYEAAVGGGDSESGNGGDAIIHVSGGLFDGGSIGGGDSESGQGGNASIYITGGTLDCASIGGGDSDSGVPGSVSATADPATNPLGAGIYIAGDTKIIVKSGYIGGGANTAGDIGKATAYINATHEESLIQGQFILCNNTSTEADHCFFVMEAGTIDNTDLEDVDGEDYPRMKAHGGAVYMEDANGMVSVNGGIIQNSTGTLGGAVYMTDGSFTIDGGIIQNCEAVDGGGAVYMGGGTFHLKSGSIGTEGHPNTSDETGGGVYLSGSGTFNMSGGSLSYNIGTTGGGGAYVNGGTVTITGGTVIYNRTADDSGSGGGVFANGGSVSIESASIKHNTAGTSGGGVYAGGGSVTLTSSTITNNTATNYDGGGVCAAGGTLILDGGEVADNAAGNNGGGFFVNPGANTTTTIRNQAYIHDNTATNGGGAYVVSGKLVVKTAAGSKDTPTRINANTASTNGGGVFVEDGDVTLTSVTMDGNEAGTSGGAIYAGGGDITLTSTTLTNNTATGGDGGGIYAVGAVTVETSSSISDNHADSGKGGGIYADADENTVTVQTSSSITDNTAMNGAGIYAASGNVQVLSGSIMSGNTTTADGGGIYANGGSITVNPGNASMVAMTDNHADNGNGGAIYANGGTVHFSNGTINANTATNGGAIYANGGLVDFSDGTIGNNYASARGGGLYITTNGTLELKGTATLTGNHVPSTGEGGGVYLAGVVKVGSNGGTSSNPKTDAVIAEDNYADDLVNPTITATNRNNVYLPQPRVNGNASSNDGHKDVITIYPYGMALQTPGGKEAATHVGFSVPRNYVPVIFCTDDAYLGANKPALEATVFDDSEQYLTIWNGSAPYDAHYIYLSGLLWTEAVNELPEEGFAVDSEGDVTITNAEGLAWLITYVNGRGGDHPMTPNPLEGKTVTLALEDDVDMGRCGWVPIGTEGNEFRGTFDGQGHTISNIIATFGDNPGLFGTVSGDALIKDVFVKGVTLSCTKNDGGTYYMGCLASTLAGNATISNCGADGEMDCLENAVGTIMGGLVGHMVADEGQTPSVYSCFATPSMNGFTMGGLVGLMDNGYIANSFTYPKFTYSGPYVDPENPTTTQDYYIGGLVAEMDATNTDVICTLENCYAHEQVDSDRGSGLFGWLAGKYTSGTFAYCYVPEDGNYIHPTSTGTLGNTGYGWFAPTVLQSDKYGFKHRDQDVTAAEGQDNEYIENGSIDEKGNLYGLLATLNNWVKGQPASLGYSTWTRTMGSHINEDYPVLKYADYICLGSENGVSISYKNNLDDMIAGFLDGDIYLYDTPEPVNKSTGAGVRVYIEPSIGITQVQPNNVLNARVGVTFDNSDAGWLGGKPYDWHMFSSALQAAPMGLVYHSHDEDYDGVSDYVVGNNYDSYYTNGIPHNVFNDRVNMDPPMTTWNQTLGRIGYFPTDTPYGTWRDIPASSGSFDFYCYDEKSCHYINFKREGREGFYDHWSQYEYPEGSNHLNIRYGNETEMQKGKGYLMALSAPSMLMADGTLTNGSFNYTATYTQSGGYGNDVAGCNLLGNPYQSYLDFDEFAARNSIDTYYILDADAKGYLAYTKGQTPQESDWMSGVMAYNATRYIHPHQGFFVNVNTQTPVTFDNNMRLAKVPEDYEGDVHFREWTPKYPLVNLCLTDMSGLNDYATVELDRPETGGGAKVQGLRTSTGTVWAHVEGNDYQVAFVPSGVMEVPVRFKAYEDEVFTLRWETRNAEFKYLHLIDNLTGMDINCLLTDEYRFEGKMTDYTSRFRLVFDFTGIDEHEDNDASADAAPFAFMMGDELVVNGEGLLQVFDMTGRLLKSTNVKGAQSIVALPSAAVGMYILRLMDNRQVRVQKMVNSK